MQSPTDVRIADEIERIAAALGRRCVVERSWPASVGTTWRVVQICPMCDIELVLTFTRTSDTVPGEWLHRQLFLLYDDHRCHVALASATAAQLDELYARAERESLRAAERALAIRTDERRPPLVERADLESQRMIELARALEQRR